MKVSKCLAPVSHPRVVANEEATDADLGELLEPTRYTTEEWRQLICFWLAGLLNNSSYVIMIAGKSNSHLCNL